MEESMMEIVPQLEKRTPYLALLSNIATLFGLLGQGLMGLIAAFPRVRCQLSAEKASLLAAGACRGHELYRLRWDEPRFRCCCCMHA